MKKYAIIFGSSRSNGGTISAVKWVMERLDEPLLIDLAKYSIADFDYTYANGNDDFLNVVKTVMEYEIIIFATLIYWYTMSAPMKRFIDRITDLLTIHKDIGRKLRQKKMAVICSYATHPEGKDGFEHIFINTANYLGMSYLGCYFHYAGDLVKIQENNPHELIKFIDSIQSLS